MTEDKKHITTDLGMLYFLKAWLAFASGLSDSIESPMATDSIIMYLTLKRNQRCVNCKAK